MLLPHISIGLPFHPMRLSGLQATAVALTTLSILQLSSQGSEISYSSRPGTGTTFGSAAEYAANWAALVAALPIPPAGYGDATISTWDWPVPGNISNHGLLAGGASQELAYCFKVDFWVDAIEAGPFDVRIAPDFGHGGAAFLDGAVVDYDSSDLWWNTNWNNTGDLLSFNAVLGEGAHTLIVYGQEGCCDGPTAAQFSYDGTWIAFGVNDGLNKPNGVPDTGSAGTMLGLGFGTLFGLRRLRRYVLHPFPEQH